MRLKAILLSASIAGAAALTGAPTSAAADTKTIVTYTITGSDPGYFTFGPDAPVDAPTGTQLADFSQVDTVTFDNATGVASISSSDSAAKAIWFPAQTNSPSKDTLAIASDPGTLTVPMLGLLLDYALDPNGNSFGLFINAPLSSNPTLLVGSIEATDGSGYKIEYGVENITSTPPVVETVPEPGAWALILIGAGMTGATLRGDRRRSAVLSA